MAFANVHRIDPGWKLWRFSFDSFPNGKWEPDHKSFIVVPSLALQWTRYNGLFYAAIWLRFPFKSCCISYYRPQPKTKPILPSQLTGKNENPKMKTDTPHTDSVEQMFQKPDMSPQDCLSYALKICGYLERKNMMLQEDLEAAIKAGAKREADLLVMLGNDESLEDKARLDWMEIRGPWESWTMEEEQDIVLRKPIRASIDAARKASTP